MAILIPALNNCLARMTSGEKRLARQLEAKLEDDYLIWYDTPVGERRLQADFIILHPQQGLFVLEVKDWRLSTIAQGNPDHFLIAPQGVEIAVQNPLQQARQYAQEIQQLLQQVPQLRHPTGRHKGKLIFPYAYGVVFANIKRKAFEAQPGLAQVIDPHLAICQDEMAPAVDSGDFQARLWAMSHYDFGHTLDKDQIELIRAQLYPDVIISSHPLTPSEESRVDTATEAETAFPAVLKIMV